MDRRTVKYVFLTRQEKHSVRINMDTDALLPQFFSPYPIESEETVYSSMAGIVGTWGRERGLTFYEVELAGHELPRYE